MGAMTMAGPAHPPGPSVPQPERIVARVRRHARVLTWPALLLIVVAAAVGYFAGNLPEPWMDLAVLAGAGLVVLGGCLIPFLAWLARRTTITTRRIIRRSGLFVREREELLHSRGYNVTVRKNGLQSMFGCADVRIDTGAGRLIVLRDVPNANLVQSVLGELVERARADVAATGQHPGSIPGQPIPRSR